MFHAIRRQLTAIGRFGGEWSSAVRRVSVRQPKLGRGILALVSSFCVTVGVLLFASTPALAVGEHTFSTLFGSAGSGPGEFSEPVSVAVNESTKDVYVVDKGNDRVEWFSATGTFEGEFNGSGLLINEGLKAAGSGELPNEMKTGQFDAPEGIAIDNDPSSPSFEDVYVADVGHHVIDKFSSTGAYLGQITEGAGGARLHELDGVAVDTNGLVWVYQSESGSIGEIDSYSGALFNAFLSSRKTPEGQRPGFAVDSEDNLYANETFRKTRKLNSSGEVLQEKVGSEEEEKVSGVAVELSSNRVYLDNLGRIGVYSASGSRLESLGGEYPRVEAGGGVGVSSSGGMVYVTDTAADVVDAYAAVVGAGISDEAAVNVQSTAATLQAQINPDETETTYHFEYDTSPYTTSASHGTSLPVPDVGIGSGSSAVPVSVLVTGLQAGATYYYRVVAVSEVGGTPKTVDGLGKTLTTPVLPGSAPAGCSNEQRRAEQPYGLRLPDCRAYEMVSPLDKNDGDAVYGPEDDATRSSLSGDAVTYESAGVFPGAEGAQSANEYLARREPEKDGWSTQPITPPYLAYHTILSDGSYYSMAFTPELTEGIAATDLPLTSEALSKYTNLYVADFATTPISYQLVTNEFAPNGPIDPEYKAARNQFQEVAGVSTDLSHVVYGEEGEVYAWVDGALSLVSVGPEGEPLPPQTAYAGSGGEPGNNFGDDSWRSVSAAGTQVFFSANEEDGTRQQLYVRENVGQPQSPLAPGASGTGELTNGSASVSKVVTSNGAFQVGQYISGPGIPAATTITAVGSGTLTLSQRDNGSSGEVALSSVGQCTDSADACTVEVSASQRLVRDPAGNGNARFWGASVDGSRVFFTNCVKLTEDATAADNEPGDACPVDNEVGNDLYEYDLEKPEGERLTDLTVDHHAGDTDGAKVLGVVDISEDGSYVYFVAEGTLTTGKNAEGKEPVSREPNLYVAHLQGGSWTTSFIATLAPETSYSGAGGDQQGGDSPDWREIPPLNTVRETPDGTHLAFPSTKSLTGYVNSDANTGLPDREVFSYEAESEKLTCVSCNPSGARPIGPSSLGATQTFVTSSMGYTPRNFSEDGTRLFFDSEDALVPQDSNGRPDVYEWEQPAAQPEPDDSCTRSSSSFSESNGGCIFPISDVAGDYESFFLDASPNGNDVFFATEDQLVPADTDFHIDVYDARVGGGFPVAVEPPPCNNGDSCKGPVSPQPSVFGAPASATFSGAGNVTPAPAPVVVKPTPKPVKCKKGYAKKKGKCVKRKPKKKAKKSTRHSNKGRK